MSSPTKEASTSADKRNNDDLSLTEKKTYLPLAIAGGLGGVCNGGIQLVIPNERNNDLIPNLDLPIGYEFLIYLPFSLILGAILGPTLAMLTVGLPNIKNLNRVLVLSAGFATFLTASIEIGRNIVFTSSKRKDFIAAQNESVEQVPTTKNDILIPENTKLKADTFFQTAKLLDDDLVVESNIDKLKELKSEVEKSKDSENSEIKKEKQDLINDITKKVNKLEN